MIFHSNIVFLIFASFSHYTVACHLKGTTRTVIIPRPFNYNENMHALPEINAVLIYTLMFLNKYYFKS